MKSAVKGGTGKRQENTKSSKGENKRPVKANDKKEGKKSAQEKIGQTGNHLKKNIFQK